MSDDLVKRLRSIDDDQICTGCYTIVEAADEAADRIEKLETALRRIKEMHHDGGVNDLQERDDRTYCVVYEALEGKIYNALNAE
jgi:ADP-ribose pyrophosphatase YjhB (NUDIX family)